MIDDKTITQHWPLPHPDNLLSGDVLRVRATFQALDGAVDDLQKDVAAKASQSDFSKTATDHGQRLDKLQQQADALEEGKVASVNGVDTRTGVDITLLPEHLHLGPANGPGAATVSYDSATGRVIEIVLTFDGAPGTTTIAYGANGTVAQTQTLYRGLLRTVTFSTDGAGRVTGFSATEVSA